MKLDESMRELEIELGRSFADDLKDSKARPPWVASAADLKIANKLIPAIRLWG